MPLGLGGFDKSLDFQHRDPNLQMAAFTPRLVRKVMDSLELRMHNPDMRDLSGTGLCTSPSLGAMCWSLSRGIRKKRGKGEGEIDSGFPLGFQGSRSPNGTERRC